MTDFDLEYPMPTFRPIKGEEEMIARTVPIAAGETINVGDVVSIWNGQAYKGVGIQYGGTSDFLDYNVKSQSLQYFCAPIKVTDSIFIVPFWDQGTSNTIALFGVNKFGNIGAKRQVSGLNPQYLKGTGVDSTHFVIMYRRTDNMWVVRLGYVDPVTLAITMGTEYGLSLYVDYSMSHLISLPPSKFVMIPCHRNGSPWGSYANVGDATLFPSINLGPTSPSLWFPWSTDTNTIVFWRYDADTIVGITWYPAGGVGSERAYLRTKSFDISGLSILNIQQQNYNGSYQGSPFPLRADGRGDLTFVQRNIDIYSWNKWVFSTLPNGSYKFPADKRFDILGNYSAMIGRINYGFQISYDKFIENLSGKMVFLGYNTNVPSTEVFAFIYLNDDESVSISIPFYYPSGRMASYLFPMLFDDRTIGFVENYNLSVPYAKFRMATITHADLVGIARATDGSVVSIVLEGIAPATGLTPDQLYYGNFDGTLTLDNTGYQVGLSLASNQLFVRQV